MSEGQVVKVARDSGLGTRPTVLLHHVQIQRVDRGAEHGVLATEGGELFEPQSVEDFTTVLDEALAE